MKKASGSRETELSGEAVDLLWSLEPGDLKEIVDPYGEAGRILRRNLRDKVFLMRVEAAGEPARSFAFRDRKEWNKEWTKWDKALQKRAAKALERRRKEMEKEGRKHAHEGVHVSLQAHGQPRLKEGVFTCPTCGREIGGLYGKAGDLPAFRDVSTKAEWIRKWNSLQRKGVDAKIGLEKYLQKGTYLRSRFPEEPEGASGSFRIMCPDCETVHNVAASFHCVEETMEALTMEQLRKLKAPRKWLLRAGVNSVEELSSREFQGLVEHVRREASSRIIS